MACSIQNWAVATIEISGHKISTKEDIPETPYRMITPIQIYNDVVGQVSVFYTEEKPFILPEERTLLEGCCGVGWAVVPAAKNEGPVG